MACKESQPEMSDQTVKQRNSLMKTSAEIVSEARKSLRVQSTKRPFTPRDGHRHLFGKNTVRASHDNRPPSSFRSVTNQLKIQLILWSSSLNRVYDATCGINTMILYISVFMLKILMLLTPDQVPGLASLLWTMYVCLDWYIIFVSSSLYLHTQCWSYEHYH